MSVDPLADHPNQVDKSPYAYAWNNPVYWTDPDGRCPECPPWIRLKMHAGVTGGYLGFETKILGAQTGVGVNLGSEDYLGLNLNLDDVNGLEVTPSTFHDTEERWSISAGNIFGGEIGVTTNDNVTEEVDFTASMGLFSWGLTDNLSDSKEPQEITSIGIGYSAGIGIIGLDVSLTIELLGINQPPEGWIPPPDDFKMEQDNTYLELIEIDLNDNH